MESMCHRQVTITCGPACVRKSALIGMPQNLVAGVARMLTVHARDASGCPTEGRDPVSITVDSVCEGVRALRIKVCPFSYPFHISLPHRLHNYLAFC